nr:RNA-directed DNA polymerase, eukaryota [Tanacetum cinerariifolium]
KKKLQALKIAIKAWSKGANKRSNDRKISIQQNLSEVDKLIDQGKSNDEILIKRITLLNDLQELNNRNAMEISQKSQNLMQFLPIQAPSICFVFTFPTRLSSDQVQDLERTVTYEEVKRAVWDCGTNKSPGPDGFSFEFYPFIPKIQDAKFVKDIRPISLIGSVYKIIAKILANRLCVVLPYLISDVQSAFVANRQILDGPFILNELLSWCSSYLNNAMGSVLVNGSPTLEFQFHKGLKQGLKINLDKSKLMRIGVSSNVVAVAASLIGCSILTAPLNYLAVKVGSNMSRITLWDDVISKVLYKRLAALEMCKSITVAEKMGHPSLSRSFHRMPRGSQEFSVKSSRILIDNTILSKAEVPTRWLRVVPIKVNVHALRVCLDKLPTRANLSLRGMDIPSIACPLSKRVQHTSNLENSLDFEAEILKEEVQEHEAIALSDEEVAMDEAASEARSNKGEEIYDMTLVRTLETKMDNISDMEVKYLWGNTNFDFIFSEALAYAPQVGSYKRILWTYLDLLSNRWNGECIVIGDFNEVRRVEEQWGSCFNMGGARVFNNFISNAGLIDLQLEGFNFTWAHPSATKMSKLDRFLASGGIISSFLCASAVCLDKHLSDHRPILLREAAETRDIMQKAKIKWAIEGDENSKFFHGMVNRKRTNLAVKGIMIDGVWVDEPRRVKNEFRDYFATRFQDPGICQGKINFLFPKRLCLEHAADLELHITRDEIQNAVWSCGENKSPGPDGFSFEFFRKFWHVVGSDFCTAVEWFFDHASFPIGCNSSFIALIPKSLEPNVLGDFRPISLIGSVYKVITKILQSQLSSVISDLISDVQTAFLPNRQILDGPFIINELLARCHHKKQQAMIFKVDFAKAYDSIRWDYLEEQGDPLAPYLFILVMESLHLSFSRVIDAGIFTGVRIDPSIMIYHLFYANDVVFIGEWSQENLKGIMQMLRCFSLMSGLAINIKKSHLLGVGVPSHFVNEAVDLLGCSIMKTPFKYLGITVGGSASLVKSWDETINKLKLRLSNWRLKTLSIRGRFTLIKSVLGSTPIYNMSLYKVPKTVLNAMESIRRNFFNGIQDGDKKISWIKRAKVLASKDHGGLGVSSFYALNMALLSKWVWRFLSRDNSIWFRTTHAIHGSQEQGLSAAFSSNWSSIIKEIKVLFTQGIDFTSHCKIKVRNGRSTSFWKDLWIGNTRLCHKFPRLFALDVNKEGTVASKLSVPLSSSFRRDVRGDRYFLDLNGDGEFRVKDIRLLL